ncbi:PAS domain-containing protein [Guptibacillus hwajinpoensis]|uniref:PAS domain-containing protein n=1 Tax=Guptibacillus hwajinpoensis TaxID=208199 RepID=UPI00273D2CB4|nr:PAS domain-containing protein [Pseudalkalibacillus hwajinpoensis]WLR58792.1 PAS domain-containing protein [Pseudalkalibacillus hwajinpoensis]
MERPTLTLIAGSTQTKKVLYDQLHQLAGDYIAVRAFAIDETLPNQIEDHVILYSSETTKSEAATLSLITGKEAFVGKRTIRHDYIDRLLTIPPGERVLMVNDDEPSTIDVIESLYQLGINHVTFLPFKRGQMFYDNIHIAVSPGETHLCPSYIPQIIDIGVRPFDIATIIKVMDYFQLDDSVSSKVSERYIRSMIALHRKILVAEQDAVQTTEHYQNVVNTVDDGILAINKNKEITLFNHRLEALLQTQARDVIGHDISNVIDHDLREFIMDGLEENKFVSMNGVDVVAFRQSIPEEEAIVVTFKSVNQAFEIEKTAQREQHKKRIHRKV